MRTYLKYQPEDRDEFASKLMLWATTKEVFGFFKDNQLKDQGIEYKGFRSLAGIGAVSCINSGTQDGFAQLKNYLETTKDDTLIGFFSYDLKNHIEKLHSGNADEVNMPLIHFFQPEWLFSVSENGKEIEVGFFEERQDAQEIIALCRQIEGIRLDEPIPSAVKKHPLCRVSREQYIETVKKIKDHIQMGDVYEVNYCIEFFLENTEINPYRVYKKLSEISSAPFSCFYKVDNKYLVSASPERFIKKTGQRITAQPMKGTIRRDSDPLKDAGKKHELLASEKERAENVMIVDLVRNDLSKTAKKNSVKVDELYGVYSFPQVHQMVSTVSAEMRDDADIVDVIKAAFPMGSMTGAPKVKAMELIEQYEITKRGLFSGAVGYITPEHDFDFNVVIRSIQYNEEKKYLSFMVGSAITINSDPESEYEECLLKAKALIEAIQ